MLKVFVIEPIGKRSDYLFQTMGSCFEFVSNHKDADIYFYDEYCGFGTYDKSVINYVLINRQPVCSFNFHDYNDNVLWPGFNNWTDKVGEDWADNIRAFSLLGLIKAYFMRKMNKALEYPSYVYPIDSCLIPGHDFPMISKDNFAARHFDICWIGATSPWRSNIVAGLLKAKAIHVDYQFTNERIPHEDWLNRHRNAKFYLEVQGGGYGSERNHQLYSIGAQLRQRSNHLLPHPFTDMVNCVEIGDKDGHISETDLNKLLLLLNDNDKMYSIYCAGYDHMKTYYSEEARAKYIFKTIENIL